MSDYRLGDCQQQEEEESPHCSSTYFLHHSEHATTDKHSSSCCPFPITMSKENQSYIGYKPTVKDPGPALTAWTVCLCILVYCSLPLWLRLASRWDQQCKARKNLTSNAATTNAKGNTLQDDGSVLGKASSFSSRSSSPVPVTKALTWQNVFLHQLLANNASYRCGHGS